tara:strand:+ start:701 stop:823 length:123 start_codon:yes stop_codon:yes gene_type:complete
MYNFATMLCGITYHSKLFKDKHTGNLKIMKESKFGLTDNL